MFREAGFDGLRRATQTPFNLILEARTDGAILHSSDPESGRQGQAFRVTCRESATSEQRLPGLRASICSSVMGQEELNLRPHAYQAISASAHRRWPLY